MQIYSLLRAVPSSVAVIVVGSNSCYLVWLLCFCLCSLVVCFYYFTSTPAFVFLLEGEGGISVRCNFDADGLRFLRLKNGAGRDWSPALATRWLRVGWYVVFMGASEVFVVTVSLYVSVCDRLTTRPVVNRVYCCSTPFCCSIKIVRNLITKLCSQFAFVLSFRSNQCHRFVCRGIVCEFTKSSSRDDRLQSVRLYSPQTPATSTTGCSVLFGSTISYASVPYSTFSFETRAQTLLLSAFTATVLVVKTMFLNQWNQPVFYTLFPVFPLSSSVFCLLIFVSLHSEFSSRKRFVC